MSYQAEVGKTLSAREEQKSLKSPGVIQRNEDTQAPLCSHTKPKEQRRIFPEHLEVPGLDTPVEKRVKVSS